MKLKTKILLTVLLTTVITLFGKEIYVIHQNKLEAEDELTAKIEKTGKLIIGAIANPVYNLDYELLGETLQLFFTDKDIKTTKFIENTGVTNVIIDKPFIPKENTIIQDLEVTYRDVSLGHVIVVYTKQNIIAKYEKSLKEAILSLLIIVVSLIILLTIIIIKITKPIEDLTELSLEISRGNLDKTINITSTDEIGTLARNFIVMKDSIKKQIEQINYENDQRRIAEQSLLELNNNLEVKVKERTNELEVAIEDLKSTQKQLIESEKMSSLGMLVAGVAHEINTPIGIAVTAASHMQDEVEKLNTAFIENKISKKYLNEYINTSDEIASIILSNMMKSRDLIQSFKNIAVDQSSEVKRKFELKKYIDEILLSTRSKFKKTNHTIEVLCEEEVFIYSYPGAISQIITNLLMNSLIHGFENIQNGEISIEVKHDLKNVTINYRDNGEGIAEDTLEHIFTPFFTTKRGQGGSGLGLSIVYNLVTSRLQGEINCSSNINKGTLFSIIIPGYEKSSS